MAASTRLAHCRRRRAAQKQDILTGSSIEEVLLEAFETCIQSKPNKRKRVVAMRPKSAREKQSQSFISVKKLKRTLQPSMLSSEAKTDSISCRDLEVESLSEESENALTEEPFVHTSVTQKESGDVAEVEKNLQPACDTADTPCTKTAAGVEGTIKSARFTSVPVITAHISMHVKKSILLDPGSITEKCFPGQNATINVLLIGLATDCRKSQPYVTSLLQVEPKCKESYEVGIKYTIADAESLVPKSFVMNGARNMYNYKIYITSKEELEKMPEDICIEFKVNFNAKTL